jgi:hypothetical protein
MQRYTHGCPGWVGLKVRDYGDRTDHSWWQGPHGLFTVTGALDASTAVYPTRAALTAALRKAGAGGLKPQKVADAEAMNLERWVSWWERVCQEADVKPDNRLPDKTIATRWARRFGSSSSPERVAEYRANWAYACRCLSTTS